MELQNSISSNTTDCFNDTKERNHLLVAMASSGGVSFIMCLIAVSVVMYLRLYKYFVYRLALYQVSACIIFSVSEVLVLMNLGYNETNSFHIRACLATAFLMQYTMWMKLLFTMCLMFHLFCLAVCLKHFKKLEYFYILLPLLLPIIPSCIPFIHHFYGLAGAWCWIQAWDHDCPSKMYKNGLGIVEQFTLWYGPLFVSLTLCLIAVIMIVLVLVRRACRRQQNEAEPLIAENRNRRALQELLPLLVYPIIFFILAVFPLVNRVYGAIPSPHGNNSYYKLFMAHSITQASWGFFSASALLIHVLYVFWSRLCLQRHKPVHIQDNTNDSVIFTSDTVGSTNASSRFTLVQESEYEKDYQNN